MSNSRYFIGLMSGTSLDAIDAALVRFEADACTFVAGIEQPFSPTLQASLHALCQPGDNEIFRMGRADREVALAFSDAVQDLLLKANMPSDTIEAIGSHGQTIRHHPNGDLGFTLQIGDPSTIAEQTSITTVADFRRRDIAAGGQGAPLVPAFHAAILSSDHPRLIINIGGISNITRLEPGSTNTTGYDIGPGNTLMDQWIQLQCQEPFDKDGAWAAAGSVQDDLLQSLLSEPYFSQPAPKSTGRELFNLEWLNRALKTQPETYTPVDIQATLLELTSTTIAADVKQHTSQGEVIICGGGAENSALMNKLRGALPNHTVQRSDDIGVSSRFMEAMAFAWLAKQTLDGQAGNIPGVTGAKRSTILGGIYPS